MRWVCCISLAVVFTLSGTEGASASPPQAADDALDSGEEVPEEFEDAVDLEELDEAPINSGTAPSSNASATGSTAPDARSAPAGLAAFIGHFHGGFAHLPIAWLILLVLADVAYLFVGMGQLARPSYILGWLTMLSFIPGIATGLMRFSALGLPPDSTQEALLHRNLMFAAFIVLSLALLVRWRSGNDLRGFGQRAYVVLVLGSCGLTVASGFLGGRMVFGAAPPFFGT